MNKIEVATALTAAAVVGLSASLFSGKQGELRGVLDHVALSQLDSAQLAKSGTNVLQMVICAM